jgi:hypothetical protein
MTYFSPMLLLSIPICLTQCKLPKRKKPPEDGLIKGAANAALNTLILFLIVDPRPRNLYGCLGSL